MTMTYEQIRNHFDRALGRVRGWASRHETWHLILAVAGGAFLLAVLSPILVVLGLAVAVLLGIALWVLEFAALMRTPASSFPGKHDRLIWVAAMFVFAPVTPLAFWVYRKLEWQEAGTWARAGASKSSEPWDTEGLM